MGDVAYETISIDAGAQIEGRLARRAALGLDDDGETPLIATPVSFRRAGARRRPAPTSRGRRFERLFAKSGARGPDLP